MAYDLYQKCGPCIDGIIIVNNTPISCPACGGTGKQIVGGIPNLETAINGLTADVASLGDICKQTFEYCEKILSLVGKS